MSLIQDALKRQQEELESSREPINTATAPSVPEAMPVAQTPEPKAALVMSRRYELKVSPPMPSEPEPKAPPPASDQADKSGKSRWLIAGIIFLCILIVLGGLSVIPQAKQTFDRFTLLLSRAPLFNRTVSAPLPPALPRVAATPKPAAAPASAPAPWISSAAAAAPAVADEGEDVEEDVAMPGVKEQEFPVTVPSPVPVVWPRLKLSAIFSNAGSGQSGARLNNRLILMGDQIDGVTLVEIRRDSVVLKFGAETRSLKMGMTVN